MFNDSTSRVSVIIPTYNRDKYISGAIESVLRQKNYGSRIEVVIVDDGSTDNTEKIVKKFKDKVLYKKIKHSGRPSVPRNVGISISTGEIIAFLDSDDEWVSNKLELQLPAFIKSDSILSYGNVSYMSKHTKISKMALVDSTHAKSGPVFLDLLNENFVSTLTVMVKKEALVKYGLFNESPSLRAIEDYELWLRLADKGSFQFVSKTLAYYRRHDENITNITDEKVIYRQFLNVFHSVSLANISHKNKKATQKRLSEIYTIYSNKVQFPENYLSKFLSKWYRIKSL